MERETSLCIPGNGALASVLTSSSGTCPHLALLGVWPCTVTVHVHWLSTRESGGQEGWLLWWICCAMCCPALGVLYSTYLPSTDCIWIMRSKREDFTALLSSILSTYLSYLCATLMNSFHRFSLCITTEEL